MALVRCEDHEPIGRKHKYKAVLEPMTPPNKAVICGKKGCLKRGLVWLSNGEAEAYLKGARYFSTRSSSLAGRDAPTAGAKILVFPQ